METPEDVLVPQTVHQNAKVALKTGKPVVLYGPTGTGKTSGNCIPSLSVEWERVDLLVCITVCGLHPRGQASGYSPCLLINCLPGVRVIYSIFLSE
ncbi:MAG: hypothetical protein J07HQW1_01357 [Haloquadratum walsbyi J07HQW1]|uniref:Uncharacterized protein n=1 Tax=Haloquadratum walsbyi J07HQW1 TaxID=1238424 RepID=U1N4J7_9EURY|nr:MAG: hypothetical protein J07HQW1_01357 [Haloquadratum walsbyi J07HQW1]